MPSNKRKRNTYKSMMKAIINPDIKPKDVVSKDTKKITSATGGGDYQKVNKI